ncbi:MAG TPA: ABC transporter substrate-binding protein [Stellaceae bacterium]
MRKLPIVILRLVRRTAIAGAVALIAFAAVAGAGRAVAATGAAEPVRGFYDTLLNTMQQAQKLGQAGRFAALDPVVRRSFDIPYMTRVAVGPSWSTLPEDKRQQLTDAFGRYITASWADRFDSYSGEKLEVGGEKPYGAAMLVETRIVKSDGEPVSINYLMRRDGAAWRIADVYLTGTISELATRRAEFTAVLRRDGVDALIATLNSKSADMTVAARS